MRHVFFTALLSVLLASACETTPKTDLAVQFFNDIAFFGSPGGYPIKGKAILETNYLKHRIRRWEDEIRIRLDGAVIPEYRKQIESTIEKLSKISGRSARFLMRDQEESDFLVGNYPYGEKPNFIVEFVDKEKFLISKTEAAPCYIHIKGNREILRVKIQISVERPALVKHCIVHELFHGFGFAHSNVLPSVVSGKSLEHDLTFWDEIALKTLYDTRLESGITRQEALPIARNIIIELLAESSRH